MSRELCSQKAIREATERPVAALRGELLRVALGLPGA
eukprot:CAMPEP_0179331666 /NCGR_PEP_ID=MMETSP0797-20121207/64311_1 /TAXON_ID=47934 /ORGANISM="Dinophysis acuminata, Strain DAEP01" /LENGTH=36 /DNA_ID= /DNA_START= /DNA_END= /DNA_ORIENTATION=